MANLSTIKEEKKKKKKGGQGNKGRTSKKKSTPKEDMKIAYTPKTEKEKRDAYLKLVRALKSGSYTPEYRWHKGGSTNFSDYD